MAALNEIQLTYHVVMVLKQEQKNVNINCTQLAAIYTVQVYVMSAIFSGTFFYFLLHQQQQQQQQGNIKKLYLVERKQVDNRR